MRCTDIRKGDAMATLDQRYDDAIALSDADKPDEAVAALEEILREDPSHALAHTALSVLYGRLDRHHDAVHHAEEVCRLEPDDPLSYISKSIVCRKAGDNTGAEEAMALAMRKQWESASPKKN